MNINNLQKVSDLQSRLKNAVNTHDAAVALTAPKGGRFGLDERAYVTIGGDSYGNGKLYQFDIKIIDSPEMIAACRKIQSEAWGKVVGLRYELRELGVILE